MHLNLFIKQLMFLTLMIMGIFAQTDNNIGIYSNYLDFHKEIRFSADVRALEYGVIDVGGVR